MKNLFLIIITCFLFTGCSSQVNDYTYKYIEPVKTIDQELGQRVFNCDSTVNVRDLQIDSMAFLIASQSRAIDSLKNQLFLSNFKIEKVKYYIKICQTKPTNNKFFKGWVIRAVK